MALVAEALPFDSCWWGRATARGRLHRVHCSYLLDLPLDVPARVNADDPANLVALRLTQAPDQAHCFGSEDLEAASTTAVLAAYMGVSRMLCISSFDGPPDMISFVCVARTDSSPAFTAPEGRFLELVMPHLSAALDACCSAQLGRLRHGGREAMLASDAYGWIHLAESGAHALLRNEFPGWSGQQLPDPLAACVAARRPSFLGRRLHADITWSGEHSLLALRPRDAGDLLTRREAAVAKAYCAGQSYKEVAQRLSLAPATVRHHLRNVYLKLNVSDKGALALQLGAHPEIGPARPATLRGPRG